MNDVRPTQRNPDIVEVLEIGPKSGRRRRRWLIGTGVVAAIVIGGGLALLTQKHPVKYELGKVEETTIDVKVTATGTLQPVNQVEVGVEVSGTIRTINVEVNDRVKKGEVLAAIDTDQLNARLAQSRASLAQARAGRLEAAATLKETELAFARTRKLVPTGYASPQALDTVRATLERARASTQRAQAQVSLAEAAVAADETTLAKATIRAPIEGIVLARNVEPGQTVAAAFQTPILFTLADDLAHMELHVDIDEADMGVVKEGQSATFSVDAYPGRAFKARITSVHNAPHTVQGVATYEGLLTVDNPDFALKPGMTATADILTEHVEHVLSVPSGALRFIPEGAKQMPPEPIGDKSRDFRGQVYRVVGGKPEAVKVIAGSSDGTRTQIRDGNLKAGDVVILDIERKAKPKAP